MVDKCFTISNRKIAAEWKPHPKFSGVAMAEIDFEKGNGWRSFIVKVDALKSISPHIHEDEIEFHFVVSGSGSARRGKETIEYWPGDIYKIPRKIVHEISAGNEGIELFSIFVKE